MDEYSESSVDVAPDIEPVDTSDEYSDDYSEDGSDLAVDPEDYDDLLEDVEDWPEDEEDLAVDFEDLSEDEEDVEDDLAVDYEDLSEDEEDVEDDLAVDYEDLSEDEEDEEDAEDDLAVDFEVLSEDEEDDLAVDYEDFSEDEEDDLAVDYEDFSEDEEDAEDNLAVDYEDFSEDEEDAEDNLAVDYKDFSDQADDVNAAADTEVADDERFTDEWSRRDDIDAGLDVAEDSSTVSTGASDNSDVAPEAALSDSSEPMNVYDMTQEEARSHLSQYMNEHNYGRDDFDAYSMDPTWRNLQRKAFPDYEMPDIPQDKAQEMLSDYMNERNYDRDDLFTCSQDETWRELQRYANPEYEQPPLFHRDLANADDPFDIEYVNPNFDAGEAWQENCQRCVPTYELRRRGYDVEALPLPDATDLHDLQYEPFGAWVDPDVRRATGTGLEDIESAMGEWGDGARAQVVVKWNGEDAGHTFVAEQEDGRTLFVDPQDPSVDARAYFGLKNGKPLIEEGSVSFCRTDTLQPSSRIFDACKGRE